MGVHPDRLAGLTDWQLHHLYGHAKDDRGILVRPKEPARAMTLVEELATAEAALITLGVAPEGIERALAKIRAAHGEGG